MAKAKITKITFPADLPVSAGIGYDLHRLVEGRKLILGGVEIPHTKGLLGHIDADVLTHAIIDALLSAVGLRDIGCQFPDTDKAFKDIDSFFLLEKVLAMLTSRDFKVNNVAATIIAQQPKLSTHIPTITASLAKKLGLDMCKVGITATTNEGVGEIGDGNAIAVSAIATVLKIR
jgi:2-C-methyl-D-erythritol 2,4-cyclodiphosphate synthase